MTMSRTCLVESSLVSLWGTQFDEDTLLLHSEWHDEFTPQTYRTALSMLNQVKDWAREMGFKALNTLVPYSDDTGAKYVTMFGFTPEDGNAYKDPQGDLFVEYRLNLEE